MNESAVEIANALAIIMIVPSAVSCSTCYAYLMDCIPCCVLITTLTKSMSMEYVPVIEDDESSVEFWEQGLYQ